MYKFKIIESDNKEEQEKALEDFMKDKTLIDISFSLYHKKIKFTYAIQDYESVLKGQETEQCIYSCLITYKIN